MEPMQPNHQGVYKDSRNQFITRSLFVETHAPNFGSDNTYNPVFSLSSYVDYVDDKWEYEVLSIPKRYMEIGDVTEYTFATEVFKSFEHWEQLCNKNWFQPYLSRLRKELELSMKSKAVDKINMKAADGNLNALKYIASKEWKKEVADTRTNEVSRNDESLEDKKRTKRGRPSNNTKPSVDPDLIKIIKKDMDRIGIISAQKEESA